MKTYFTTLILMGLFFASTFTASFAQTLWTKDTLNNPVLNPGPSGAWDDEYIAMPCILFDGSTYQMWYSIRNDRTRSIGYATSMDGINWTKYNDSTTTTTLYSESDPVLSPGDSGKWDEKSVEAPSVIIIDSVYHMWYRGKNYPGGSSSSIGHATSVDGINWEKDTLNNPVLSPGSPGSWDAGYVGYHTVVFDGSTYHLWYKAWNGGTGTNNHNQIGHATSPHPDSSWTKDPANPVLSFGSSGDWDNPTVFFPNVIYDGNTYHIWYSGGERFEWKIGYAISQDGSNWTKYANNPVLGWGSLGSWDDTWVGICSVVLDSTNSIFKMWYTGSGGGSDGHIGYANAEVSYEALFEFDVDSTAVEFTDISIGIITEWLWDFGDDSSSTVRNPAHTYVDGGTYTITLTVNGPYGSDSSSHKINVVDGIEEKFSNIPKGYTLKQNYPNPFNPTTNIDFSIPKREFVTLKIYNLLGQEISTLVSEKLNAGSYTFSWDVGTLSSGVYLYKLQADTYHDTKKMILLK